MKKFTRKDLPNRETELVIVDGKAECEVESESTREAIREFVRQDMKKVLSEMKNQRQ